MELDEESKVNGQQQVAAKSGEHTIASEAITLITEDNMDFNTPTVPQEVIADEQQTNKSNGSGSGN